MSTPGTPHSQLAVSEPESFPNPIIRRSAMRKLNVVMNNGSVEKKSVIDAGSGRFYELGAQIRKAIFGYVVHAVLLRAVDGENFVRTENEMAIKVYSKKTLRALQGKTQENPLMEITALQFIGDTHPNIMGQIECCTDEENIYSIMRFCKGGELFDFVDENGPLSEHQAKQMFRQLLDGMARLSELGIGHRDMSLENILYDPSNNACHLYVVIDFGMCVRLKRNPNSAASTPANSPVSHGNNTNLTSYQSVVDAQNYCLIAKQTICGKKNYIAPEVLRGDQFFNPMLCDVWAAGIILFIALTGVPPVDKATFADERYSMICENRLGEMLQAWGMDLSPEATHLMQNILRPNPQDRLTIREMMDHPWLRGVPSPRDAMCNNNHK